MRPELVLVLAAASAAGASDFATSVITYEPAPGLSPLTDPAEAVGAPQGGGTTNGNAVSVVSLGGFGGSIVLGFDHTVADDPRNPLGLDAIVFGNAFWQCLDGCLAANPNNRWLEAGVIEISADTNANGLADDAWYVIPGSSLPPVPQDAFRVQSWPSSPDTAGFELPAAFAPPPPFFVINPLNASELHWGYADASPVLRLGDLTGSLGFPGQDALDDPEDDPAIDPAVFYTMPDNPNVIGIDAGSGGGDAFDIAWAVDPATGDPAGLTGFDFIRIRTGVMADLGPLGEISTEIDAVADVRAAGDFNGDGVVDGADLAALLAAWGTPHPRADLNHDGVVDGADLAVLLAAWG